ncbi:hypothetical protein [Pseudoxanthomonas winnipegensis]|uniref:Uncharacterized protein n=1 Tax=Pseudoxanthomonas winnipegensis TaxID=2480810 RepID=A0A4V6MKP0_9GAMM|nr:hypothetical protein [Pseudoxanthomonas winnipegensis]RZZ81411.1 hypothetical protein EA663_20520 [Pseudoxanthomonas winnipegensis]TAA25406.1 hypothetical protein EA660_08060 [Pseudoxanthomonas winnipegensis]
MDRRRFLTALGLAPAVAALAKIPAAPAAAPILAAKVKAADQLPVKEITADRVVFRSPGSKAYLEVSDQGYRFYDENGVLRVAMGVL